MKKRFTILIIFFSFTSLSSQDYDVGIRAGLNFAKFLGPSETGVVENFSLSSGFHFGINFQWNFNSVLGVRSEVLYTQIGSQYTFNGEGYYVFDLPTFSRFVVRDISQIDLDISNAHISFPITAHITVTEKLEIFGGGYLNLLVSPIGTGSWKFGVLDENAPDYAFDQGLDYDYNSDRAGEFNLFARSIGIIVNDQNVDLNGIVGAYYLFDTVEENRFTKVDYGLIGGAAYYLNKGLFVSARLEYGLTDITNTRADNSLKDINSNGTFIFNDDYDRNLNIAISMGFKF